MAANINSFASVRVPAWHGLGTVLDAPVSPLEFQTVAGLDWTVSLEELAHNMIETAGLENYRAVVRSDNRTALGVVGKKYAPVQNCEMFAFLNDLREFDLDLVVALVKPERRDATVQRAGLVFERLCRRGILLNQRRVLLRRLVQTHL